MLYSILIILSIINFIATGIFILAEYILKINTNPPIIYFISTIVFISFFNVKIEINEEKIYLIISQKK